MARQRAAPDPVLGDVVRERLATLLAEVPARRAIEPAPVQVPARDVAPPDEPRTAGRQVELDDAGGSAAAWGRSVLRFTRQHLLAVGILLLTGCLWAGYNVLQARSTPVVAPSSPSPSVVATPSPTPSATPVLVHVLGAVARPGVVTLGEGSRVLDAINAAGGLTADADPGELNLAAVVADGSQVVIGSRDDPRGEVRAATPAAGGPADGTVSLNTATQAQLEELPGVGPVTAGRIIAWREQHGRFSRVEELQEVEGIGPKIYADLVPHVGL